MTATADTGMSDVVALPNRNFALPYKRQNRPSAAKESGTKGRAKKHLRTRSLAASSQTASTMPLLALHTHMKNSGSTRSGCVAAGSGEGDAHVYTTPPSACPQPNSTPARGRAPNARAWARACLLASSSTLSFGSTIAALRHRARRQQRQSEGRGQRGFVGGRA